MAIIGYDPEKEEVPNDQKIKNCFTLSVVMLVGMPLVGVLLYFFKRKMISNEVVTEESGQQIFGAYVILAIFLTISIIFTLGYLRRQLRKEEASKKEEG